jgi:hypothetical protein
MHARLTRRLWGFIPGLVVLCLVLWLNWTVLWALLTFAFIGMTAWLLFLFLRGIWRGWKADDARR